MTKKMYKAFVKSKETGELTIIESEYTSKKDFARDLRANGYAVKFISTPEKFDEDSENYNWELKRRKNVREAMKQHKASKEQAERETIDMKTQVINNNSAEIQVAVENWYMNGKPSSSYFTMNGEKYAVLPRYGTSNEFDAFKVKTFTIGEGTYHYPYYDPETREPIDRIAVVTIPDELVIKKKEQIDEANHGNTLFKEFFKV